jgi:hypothetical protein
LIAGSAASFTCAAAAASAPKPRARLLAAWTTWPLRAWHSAAGTFQRCAAAAINRTRALAPACCRNSREARTARLPPVPMRW